MQCNRCVFEVLLSFARVFIIISRSMNVDICQQLKMIKSSTKPLEVLPTNYEAEKPSHRSIRLIYLIMHLLDFVKT